MYYVCPFVQLKIWLCFLGNIPTVHIKDLGEDPRGKGKSTSISFRTNLLYSLELLVC